MVINIWRYDDARKKARTPKRVEDLAFATALSRARYILDIQLTPENEAVIKQLSAAAAYPNDAKGNPDRIQGQRAYNLASSDPVGHSEEIAIYGARAGLERFWHLAVSSRKGDELTPAQLEHVRQVIMRVLGVEDCPSIWAVHGDTDNQHMHGLIVSFLPAEDRSVKFGQGWWKEACQIAAASQGGFTYRFLDDPVLLREYASDRSVLTDLQMQINLQAIDAIQRDKRRWIAAAIASGHASIEDSRLKMARGETAWAQHFWQAQGRDPKMLRLIGVARARPELFPFDPKERPGDRALANLRDKNDPLILRIRAMRQAQDQRFYGPDRRTPAKAVGLSPHSQKHSGAREASRPEPSSQRIADVAPETAKMVRSTVRPLPIDHDQSAKR